MGLSNILILLKDLGKNLFYLPIKNSTPNQFPLSISKLDKIY